jgi:hypothetical protein
MNHTKELSKICENFSSRKLSENAENHCENTDSSAIARVLGEKGLCDISHVPDQDVTANPPAR